VFSFGKTLAKPALAPRPSASINSARRKAAPGRGLVARVITFFVIMKAPLIKDF